MSTDHFFRRILATMQKIHDSNTVAFIGLDTQYYNAQQQLQTRIHLDGAASPLAAKAGLDMVEALLPHYSNTHSYVHNSAKITTQALAWAHETVINYVGANSHEYAAVFAGAGTTAAINRVARGLAMLRPDRKVILVSSMEHHANDLPHRQFGNKVVYLPLCESEASNSNQLGAVDLLKLEELCQQHQHDINYIAVSWVSNVTGIRNPLKEIVKIAHQYGIFILLDAAQSVAHGATDLDELNVDFLVFSGHKVYCPMAPGVLVAKRSILDRLVGQDLGGGSVSTVSHYDFEFVADSSEKEESGTPNIVGAIALAAVLNELMAFGLNNIEQKDRALMLYLKSQLSSMDEITVYGDPNLERTGALAFNHKRIDHGLLAAILNDYYGIAVRNECFCAHPYVSSLLKEELWQLDLADIEENQQEAFINRKRGMVRASLSLYNTKKDVDALISAISEINLTLESHSNNYIANNDGSYQHKSYTVDWKKTLGIS